MTDTASADEYERRAESFIGEFDRFVTEQYGERCKAFDPECPCCRLWKLRDEALVITCWWDRGTTKTPER